MYFCIALTLLSLMTSTRAINVSQVLWRHEFSSDVITPGHHAVLTQTSRKMCAYRCLVNAACQSFAHQEENAICWMYGHLVDFTVVGANFSATQFYWPVRSECPLPYRLTSGVCLWPTSGKTWWQARDLCRQSGGHLLIANTIQKYNILMSHGSFSLLVGGRRLEGSWYWLNGDPVTNFWSPEQLNNSGNCLAFLDGVYGWPCNWTSLHSALCEIPYMSH